MVNESGPIVDIALQDINTVAISGLDQGHRGTYPVMDITAMIVSLGEESMIGVVNKLRFMGTVGPTFNKAVPARSRFRIIIQPSSVNPIVKTGSKTINNTENEMDNYLYGDRIELYTSPWKVSKVLSDGFDGSSRQLHQGSSERITFKVPKKLKKGFGSPFNSSIDLTGNTAYYEAWLFIEFENNDTGARDFKVEGFLEAEFSLIETTNPLLALLK